MKRILPIQLLVWALLLPLLAQSQAQPSVRSLTAYLPADQTRFQAGAQAPALPAGLPAAGTYGLKPGVAVFGWVPAWMPESYVRQVDFRLLSHVAYDGYQATEQGQLQAPAGDVAGLVKLAHAANQKCKILLGLSYQEPNAGTALFGPNGAPARQALVKVMAQQVAETGADGVHLDLTFRSQPTTTPTPETRKADKKELQSAKKKLEDTSQELKNWDGRIRKGTTDMQKAREDLRRVKPDNSRLPAYVTSYKSKQKKQHDDSLKYTQALARYRATNADLDNGNLPSDGSADGRSAAVGELLAALHKALPQATLTLGLPAAVPAAVHAGILAQAPPVALYVLQAFDYTTNSPPDKPEPLVSPLALAKSVDYYLNQNLEPANLLVGLASLGKVWSQFPHDKKGKLPEPPPYWYISSRSLTEWGLPTANPQASVVSLTLPPPPNAKQDNILKAPYNIWVDDTASLGARYKWVLSQKLGGVGIWALGFDAPDAPLWSCVRAYLARPISAPDTTAGPAKADTTIAAATEPDTLAPLTLGKAKTDTLARAASNEDQTPLDALEGLGNWVETSVVARLALLGLVILLASAWAGMVVGATRAACYWLPFARRRTWMLTLLLGVAALLAMYVSYVGHFRPRSLLAAWLTALGLLVVLWIAYRRSRPAYPLP